MDCPVCKTERLSMTERQGIEIDYCPRCRGVWLDRGELDKIIERAMVELAAASGSATGTPVPVPLAGAQPCPAPADYGHGGHRSGRQDRHGKSRPHRSFWKELFD